MKKIIGLIMIAGISYGASVVTPPGIQVNGLATNNNVMVYSNGMLLDSGVAPTNLVSVTNLTADIEELSATNAAQDALIADNTYAEGTTNKTLIDAAIAGAVNGVGYTVSNGVYIAYDSMDDLLDSLVANDMTAVLYPGRYIVTGGKDYTGLTNLSIVAVGGSAELITTIPTGYQQSSWTFANSVDTTLKNLIFILDLNVAEYGGTASLNHAYNVVGNFIGGSIDHCGFLTDSELSSSDMNGNAHSISFVQLPNPDIPPKIDDCWFAAFNSEASPANTQLAAVHYTAEFGKENKTRFRDCVFIVNQSMPIALSSIVDGQAWYYDCRTTAPTPYMPGVLALSYTEALSYLPHDYQSLLDYADTYHNVRGVDDGWTEFVAYLDGANDVWESIVTVAVDPTRAADKGYRFEVFANFDGQTFAEYLYYFDGLSKSGASISYTNGIYAESATFSQVTFSGGDMVVQFRPHSPNTNITVRGKCRLTPTTRWENIGNYGQGVYLKFDESE